VAFLAAALLVGPAASAYAQADRPGPEPRLDSWLSDLWSNLGETWDGLWTPVDRWFAATEEEGSTNTDGDGGLDPGGDGGFLDPDGAFGS
jgi:hypothetical protein